MHGEVNRCLLHVGMEAFQVPDKRPFFRHQTLDGFLVLLGEKQDHSDKPEK